MYALIENNEVLGTWKDTDPDRQGIWVPNDTRISTADTKGKPVPSGGVARILRPKEQALDWPDRAGMEWDSSINQWRRTKEPIRSPREAAVEFLVNNVPPDKPKEEETAQFLKAIRLVILDG